MVAKKTVASTDAPANTSTGGFPAGMTAPAPNTGNAGEIEMPTNHGK